MNFLNFSMPNLSLPNITIPTRVEVENWIDGQTAIGQCIAKASRSFEVFRCDPDLLGLPSNYDPASLCYAPQSIYPIHELSWARITRQLWSADLIEKAREQLVEIRGACYEQRRICSQMFNGTNETALKAFECLKPYFGNMFHFENDTSVENLCRIAYNKFGEARGLLEIDLFTRGLSFFDKECTLLEPLPLFRSGLPFEVYEGGESFLMFKAIASSIGFLAIMALNSKIRRSPRSLRVASLLSLGAASATFIHAGKWRVPNFFIDQMVQTASISFIASSAFGALYNALRKEEVVATPPKRRASSAKGARRSRSRPRHGTTKQS